VTGGAAIVAEPSPRVLDVLRLATAFLAERGVDNARLDAEVLLADCLGLDRVGVYLHFDRPLGAAERARYRELIRRRGGRVPLQHIRGRQEFFSREFRVDPRVLIPRADTETVVEELLSVAPRQARPRILDVGSGSGAIAVTVALELAAAEVFAGDVSPDAVVVGQENARRHGVEERIDFRCGDLFAPFAGERFDLVVCNPPYVPSGEIGGLAPEVRDHEPRQALDGGADGLDFYRRLSASVAGALSEGGSCVLEIGAGQREPVERLFAAAGFVESVVRRDLAGIERVLTVTRG